MKNFYKSYLRAFDKYAQCALDRLLLIKRIALYARVLNRKANQLLRRASANNLNDKSELQKEMFESGRVYIRMFSVMSIQTKMRKAQNISNDPVNSWHDILSGIDRNVS